MNKNYKDKFEKTINRASPFTDAEQSSALNHFLGQVSAVLERPESGIEKWYLVEMISNAFSYAQKK